MTTLLICRDALEDSVLGNLALARAVAKHGDEAVVIFTGEALVALDTGTFQWSPNFKTREARGKVIAGAEAAGLPFGHKEGLDSRWSDVRALVVAMKDETNVRLVACPLWSQFVELGSAVEYLERIDEDTLVDMLANAQTIVGGY